MPPEAFPWDRKDFFKEKKHERFDFGGSFPRWRDSHHGHGGSRDFARWGPGPDDFRRSIGHGKQGGYQISPEESSHGFTPSRSSERMVEDESTFRPFTYHRGEGKYGRYNNRVNNRGSFGQKDWRGNSRERENGDATSNSSGRQHHDIGAQRSVSDLIPSHHPHSSDTENSSWCPRLPFKAEHDDKMSGFDGMGTGHRNDKEQSLGSVPWKPMKWNRSNSLSSRGSSFSHSSSSKSLRADSDESKSELQPGSMTPLRSPSEEAAVGVQSAMSEETCPRKKQRLGWGQGLAKYEKQKVDVPDETPSRNGLVPCSMKSTRSMVATLPVSPRITALSECSSPPTSFGCSSSPAVEDKLHSKDGAKDADAKNDCSDLSSHAFRNFVEEFSVNLEDLQSTSSSNLGCLLNVLLQPEDASSGDSNFVKSTAMNKLLLLKTEFSKAVEKVEGEIDSCENELKLLNSEVDNALPCSSASESLQAEHEPKPCEGKGDFVSVLQRPAPLQVGSFDGKQLDETSSGDVTLRCVQAEGLEVDVDSPGTATSKFFEPLSAEEVTFTSENVNYGREIITTVPGSVDPILSGEGETNLSDSIMASNRDSARKAFEVFSNLLPNDCPKVDIWEVSSVSCQQNNLLIKEKIRARKHLQRFKEQVLTLKYRAFQHLWKEDLRLLSIRKYPAKSHKRSESSLRISHNGFQKNRSSIRSRFTCPGNMTLAPTRDIAEFTCKLLSDSQVKVNRNSLKMPALILDEKEKSSTRFASSNGLVEDPCSLEKERMTINPWIPSEKAVFMEMLATFGKDFKKIASFLDHKTTADCIEFYYKNHRSDCFANIKKKVDVRKQGRNCPSNTYLVTSGKKWNPEANAVSLDVLGIASVIAAQADESVKTQQSSVGRPLGAQDNKNIKAAHGHYAIRRKSSSSDILGDEREALAADVLAGICGAMSSEAVSSCVTSSAGPVDGCQDWKFQRNSVVDRPLTPEVMQSTDCEETCSDDSCGELDTVDWTDEEKAMFVRAFRSYGKSFAKISRCVRTRSRNQCKVFFGKARRSLGLNLTLLGSGNGATLLSDTFGGRSDTEDACAVEMESAICSNQSCTRLDAELPSFLTSTTIESSGNVSTPYIQSEPGRLGEDNETEQLDCENTDPGKVEAEKQIERKSSGTIELLRCNDESMEDSTMSCDLAVKAHVKGYLASETEAIVDQQTGQTISCGDESKSDDVDQLKTRPGASAEGIKVPVKLKILVPESGDDDRQDLKGGVDIDSSRSSSCYFVKSSRISVNDPHLEDHKNICPSINLNPNSLEVAKESQTVSWKQKENFPSVSATLLPRDCSATRYGGHLHQQATSSTPNFVDYRQPGINVCQPSLLGLHSFDGVDSSQILRGCPLKVLNKEIGRDPDLVNNEKHYVVPNFSNVMNSQSGQFLSQNIYSGKCNGSKPPRSVAELPLLTKGHGRKSSDRSRSHSRSSSDSEDLSRKFGDVKLFGQILSHLSPLQAPTSTTTATATTQKADTALSSKSFDLKLTGQGDDGAFVTSKPGASSCSGLVDYPLRSYGFWDGTRIQTGYSSLPESALLLANYPRPAVHDYSSPPSLGDQLQRPLQSVYKRKDRSLGCVSVLPTKDINGSRGLAEYQMYRSNYEGTEDLRRNDLFSELQKQLNGREKMSGFQQQHQQQHQTQEGRTAVMGMNVTGGGILVGGGGCNVVSDPVTAIKMHYAATITDLYGGGQAGSIREEENRRGDRSR